MDTVNAKEKFAFNLLSPAERAGKVTLLYIVFSTIEANTSITLNQLKWLLDTEYMIPNDVVAGAVASLTSKSLFNCVSRWQPHRNQSNAGDVKGAVHLRVRRDSPEFNEWYNESVKSYPELAVFYPPLFASKTAPPNTGVVADSISGPLPMPPKTKTQASPAPQQAQQGGPALNMPLPARHYSKGSGLHK